MWKSKTLPGGGRRAIGTRSAKRPDWVWSPLVFETLQMRNLRFKPSRGTKSSSNVLMGGIPKLNWKRSMKSWKQANAISIYRLLTVVQ